MLKDVVTKDFKKSAAYGVHIFTALGAGLGLWALILTFNGSFQKALWVLALSTVIDSVDGTLARKLNIEVLAHKIDGVLLDNIVDYLTWTIAPLFWGYMTVGIPIWVVLVCAVASVLGFSNTQAKTEDHFFKGFPSYWNFVVLYLYLLNISVLFSSIILLVFAAATFIPIKYIYPSRTVFLRPLTLVLGAVFTVQIILLLIQFNQAPDILLYSSLVFPVYYFLLSFYLNLRNIED